MRPWSRVAEKKIDINRKEEVKNIIFVYFSMSRDFNPFRKQE